jgi:beta-N-acetylhexosaminidase
MAEVAATVPELAGPSLARAKAALAARRTPEPLDVAAARAEFARLIEEHPVAPRIVTA